MALFNGPDTRLPLLTQAYQLDTENERELTDFAARYDAAPLAPDEWKQLRSVLSNLVKPIMDQELERPWYLAQNDWQELCLWHKAIWGYYTEGKPDEDGKIDTRTQVEGFLEVPGLATHLIHRIIMDLWRLVREDAENLKTCEECEHVYVIRRRQVNRFCSYRCSARRRMRERKQKQSSLRLKSIDRTETYR